MIIEVAAVYSEHSSKQFRSRVLQMDAPSSVSIHLTYSSIQRLSHPKSTGRGFLLSSMITSLSPDELVTPLNAVLLSWTIAVMARFSNPLSLNIKLITVLD